MPWTPRHCLHCRLMFCDAIDRTWLNSDTFNTYFISHRQNIGGRDDELYFDMDVARGQGGGGGRPTDLGMSPSPSGWGAVKTQNWRKREENMRKKNYKKWLKIKNIDKKWCKTQRALLGIKNFAGAAPQTLFLPLNSLQNPSLLLKFWGFRPPP